MPSFDSSGATARPGQDRSTKNADSSSPSGPRHLGEYREEIRDACVRDPGLRATELVGSVGLRDRSRASGLRVRTTVRLRKTIGTDHLGRQQAWQVSGLGSFRAIEDQRQCRDSGVCRGGNAETARLTKTVPHHGRNDLRQIESTELLWCLAAEKAERRALPQKLGQFVTISSLESVRCGCERSLRQSDRRHGRTPRCHCPAPRGSTR